MCKFGTWLKRYQEENHQNQAKSRGKIVEDHLGVWYSHFKNLLGNPAVIENEGEDIEQIHEDLPIYDGPFTIKEYKVIKKIADGWEGLQ